MDACVQRAKIRTKTFESGQRSSDSQRGCDSCTVTMNVVNILREEMEKNFAKLNQRLAFFEDVCKDRADLLTVTFEPGPLGFLVDWTSGIITFVSNEGAAKNNGVTTGWYVCGIEGVDCTADGLKEKTMGTVPFEITFKRWYPHTLVNPFNMDGQAPDTVSTPAPLEMKDQPANDGSAQAQTPESQVQWQSLVEKRFEDIERQLQDMNRRHLQSLVDARFKADVNHDHQKRFSQQLTQQSENEHSNQRQDLFAIPPEPSVHEGSSDTARAVSPYDARTKLEELEAEFKQFRDKMDGHRPQQNADLGSGKMRPNGNTRQNLLHAGLQREDALIEHMPMQPALSLHDTVDTVEAI